MRKYIKRITDFTAFHRSRHRVAVISARHIYGFGLQRGIALVSDQ